MTKVLEPFARLVVDYSNRDQERGAVLQSFGIRGLPTLVFLNAQGQESGRLTGVSSPAQIVAAAEESVR